ncbi:RICIN domain-containing protein [Lentzea sp. NPDC006480]|uniref:RICIN domain-containing protein n=1 Tax=Lentzea sp. NPDC006480 TaxID=3157176 RepID=UPI0033A782F6
MAGVVQPASGAPPIDLGVQLLNWNSTKCALARGTADQTGIVQFQCLDYKDQRWLFDDRGAGKFQIRNANSRKCLLVRGSDNEAPVVQFQCLDYADQYWELIPYTDPAVYFWVRNVNSGKCLLVRGNNDNTQLVQYTCLRYPDQAWTQWDPSWGR